MMAKRDYQEPLLWDINLIPIFTCRPISKTIRNKHEPTIEALKSWFWVYYKINSEELFYSGPLLVQNEIILP